MTAPEEQAYDYAEAYCAKDEGAGEWDGDPSEDYEADGDYCAGASAWDA